MCLSTSTHSSDDTEAYQLDAKPNVFLETSAALIYSCVVNQEKGCASAYSRRLGIHHRGNLDESNSSARRAQRNNANPIGRWGSQIYINLSSRASDLTTVRLETGTEPVSGPSTRLPPHQSGHYSLRPESRVQTKINLIEVKTSHPRELYFSPLRNLRFTIPRLQSRFSSLAGSFVSSRPSLVGLMCFSVPRVQTVS